MNCCLLFEGSIIKVSEPPSINNGLDISLGFCTKMAHQNSFTDKEEVDLYLFLTKTTVILSFSQILLRVIENNSGEKNI